ncbi:MAG: hypothetical protein J7L22_05315 [Candidatus Marinimicrobia bacterium]|nr:hypothetical protein [Candidatus Neomarinimicrobiota bacterium]
MTEHKKIQYPEDFSEKDYQYFRYKLFSDDATKEELEDICMSLVHLPTEEAKKLLEEFKHSERAAEVEWLEVAIEENQFHYLMPENEQEERDFLILKMIGEKDGMIVDLMGECQRHKYRIDKYEIESEALQHLLSENPDLEIDISVLHDLIVIEKNNLEEKEKEIEKIEKIRTRLKDMIKTERLKNLSPMDIKNFHFDGEKL